MANTVEIKRVSNGHFTVTVDGALTKFTIDNVFAGFSGNVNYYMIFEGGEERSKAITLAKAKKAIHKRFAA
jgi:hypothetical protein